MSLHYLTVQDMLWINLQVTKAVQPFRYEDLEEATFYQYGYGKSLDLLPQAARFLTGFSKVKPFAAGNDETAFFGCLAFLKINGYDVDVADGSAWLKNVLNGTIDAKDAIEQAGHPAHGEHHELQPDIKAAISGFFEKYPDLSGISIPAA